MILVVLCGIGAILFGFIVWCCGIKLEFGNLALFSNNLTKSIKFDEIYYPGFKLTNPWGDFVTFPTTIQSVNISSLPIRPKDSSESNFSLYIMYRFPEITPEQGEYIVKTYYTIENLAKHLTNRFRQVLVDTVSQYSLDTHWLPDGDSCDADNPCRTTLLDALQSSLEDVCSPLGCDIYEFLLYPPDVSDAIEDSITERAVFVQGIQNQIKRHGDSDEGITGLQEVVNENNVSEAQGELDARNTELEGDLEASMLITDASSLGLLVESYGDSIPIFRMLCDTPPDGWKDKIKDNECLPDPTDHAADNFIYQAMTEFDTLESFMACDNIVGSEDTVSDSERIMDLKILESIRNGFNEAIFEV
eukprot:gnl/Carplike_NY0171/2015_a2716_564.p1 GENE.gnl/Carplike_NY0171/2015_a2716_564~~gnl/Carplike_NY0171/2015_a2716_564.p1  ORF type:complete len:394 (-),score=60.98 gnl/Carplike_NY0171/2015_a2716_564:256-1338(-)